MSEEYLNCFHTHEMIMEIRASVILLGAVLLLWLSDACESDESDIRCLKAVKESVIDPHNSLSSWHFSNSTMDFICGFKGIKCWSVRRNRTIGVNKVQNIDLSNKGFKGQFPSGLENCTAINNLNLSHNEFSGCIPTNISKKLPFVSILDLSFNRFRGEIPVDLVNCHKLRVLNLQHNELGGDIPHQFQYLNWVTFNVANNALSGRIPAFISPIPSSSFSSYRRFYNESLNTYEGPPTSSQNFITNNPIVADLIVVWLAIGIGVLADLVFIIACFHFSNRVSSKQEEEDVERNKNDMKLEYCTTRRCCSFYISTFDKKVQKMRLMDISKATNHFDEGRIIEYGSGRVGKMYKAVNQDGSFNAIKRFHYSQHSHKEFISELTILGCLKHCNVVPLLGFCIARKERILVYKYMPKGTLYQQLHNKKSEPKFMEWHQRLRIAIGAARGLAWLHHGRNPHIIHRRISSKCILLDDDYEPKLSKFHSAVLINSFGNYISSVADAKSNDLAYVAPEYMSKLVGHRAGDVYSFGVVLLELITGQKPLQVTNARTKFKGNLVGWIAHLSKNSLLSDAIDKSLMVPCNDCSEFFEVACACVASDPEKRPKMLEVYELLQCIGKRHGFTGKD